MAKPPPAPARLPPPTPGACWRTFLKWVVGIPLLVAGALGIIWLAYWLTGSGGMFCQTESSIGTILFWLAVISLLYPVMLFIWVSDLREGLKAARVWEAMTPQARVAAIAEAEAAGLAAKPKRRSRKKG